MGILDKDLSQAEQRSCKEGDRDLKHVTSHSARFIILNKKMNVSKS
jgi:hypothetical protein